MLLLEDDDTKLLFETGRHTAFRFSKRLEREQSLPKNKKKKPIAGVSGRQHAQALCTQGHRGRAPARPRRVVVIEEAAPYALGLRVKAWLGTPRPAAAWTRSRCRTRSSTATGRRPSSCPRTASTWRRCRPGWVWRDGRLDARHPRWPAGPEGPDAPAARPGRRRGQDDRRGRRLLPRPGSRPRLSGSLREALHRRLRRPHGRRLRRRRGHRDLGPLRGPGRARAAGRQRGPRLPHHRPGDPRRHHPEPPPAAAHGQRPRPLQRGCRAAPGPGDAGHAGRGGRVLFGRACEIEPIVAAARARDVRIVEDGSQSHGARVGGRPVGTFGDIAAFSTMYRKAHITGASGGLVYSRDVELFRRALAHADRGKPRWATDFDDRDPNRFLFPALNHHTDELSCAVGLASLARLGDTIVRRLSFVTALTARMLDQDLVCRPFGYLPGDSPFVYPVVVEMLLDHVPQGGARPRRAGRGHRAEPPLPVPSGRLAVGEAAVPRRRLRHAQRPGHARPVVHALPQRELRRPRGGGHRGRDAEGRAPLPTLSGGVVGRQRRERLYWGRGDRIREVPMSGWTEAAWIDPQRPWSDPLPVPEFPERLLVYFATRCNLRCPMCPVWGSDDERAIDEVKGVMDLAAARRMLDEVMAHRPMVAPAVYGEPLLIPDVAQVFAEIKRRGMPIAVNTNGLTLTDDLARSFVDLRVDSVMFSLDAVTKETLQKVRGWTGWRRSRATSSGSCGCGAMPSTRGWACRSPSRNARTVFRIHTHEYTTFL